MTFDPYYYECISETQWFEIYDFHIREVKQLRNNISSLIAPYRIIMECEALRDMERQALLAELRRANTCQTKSSNTVRNVVTSST